MSEDTKPQFVGDPGDPEAYIKEFVSGEISYNPEKLSQAYLNLAEQATGLDRRVYQALAWCVAVSRTENRANKKIRALEERVQALEARLEKRDGA